MPSKRVEFIRALARGVLEQEVKFELPWSEVDSVLKSLPGFGPWTRAYLAIRLGREPDALPASDLGLIRAANVNTPAELSRRACSPQSTVRS
jgi:DNA-3-methyladenine glycosylase II